MYTTVAAILNTFISGVLEGEGMNEGNSIETPCACTTFTLMTIMMDPLTTL
jgi:hypothetical protein